MKLSIIICVYNTNKEHLEACLSSITASTVKDLPGGYEICMIDDGSDIDYSDLIEKYSVRCIRTENRGILSARTTGANEALGEYSIYCDSDDTVSFNYYLPMVMRAEERSADIVINDWASHTVRSKYYAKKDDTVRLDIERTGDDILLELVRNEGRQHSYYVLWNKLYRTELLRTALLELRKAGLPERTSYSEDAAINFFIWRDAKRLSNIHTGYYFYRIHPAQTVNAVSPEKLLSQIESMTLCLDIMRRSIGNNKHKDAILAHIDEWAALMARSHYSKAKGEGYTELYGRIKEKYGVDKLRISTVKDGAAYTEKGLLGTNIAEVDALLLSLWDSEDVRTVAYRGRDIYILRSLGFLIQCGKAIRVKAGADTVIPPFKIPFKERLIHNAFIYRIGLTFFKKGSRARNFLKKFM